MPIELRNDVDPFLTGAANMLIGQTQYAQRQEVAERQFELRRRQAEVQEQDAQRRAEQVRVLENARRAGTGARAINRRGDVAGDLIEAQVDLAKSANQAYTSLATDLLDGLQRREHDQVVLFGQNQQRQAALQNEQQKYGQLWDVQSAEEIERNVRDVHTGMSKQLHKLTPEGKRTYADLAGKLRSIQKMRAELPAGAYSKLLGQWTEEFEASGVQDLIVEPPTIDQELAEQSKDLGTGYTLFRQPDGSWRSLKTSYPEKQPEEIEYAKQLQEMKLQQAAYGIYKDKLAVWKLKAPDWKSFVTKNADGVQDFDQAAYDAAVKKHEASMPADPFDQSETGGEQLPQLPSDDVVEQQPAGPLQPVAVHSREELEALPSGTPVILPNGVVTTRIESGGQSPATTPKPSEGVADEQQLPQWYLDLPSGETYTAPDGTTRIKRSEPTGSATQDQPPMVDGRVVVNGEADIKRYNLPPGTPVISPEGRTGVVQ